MRTQYSPVRFGVVSHSQSVPAWQFESIKKALQVEGVELALVICETSNDLGADAFELEGGSLWKAAQRSLHSNLTQLKPSSLQEVSSGADSLLFNFARRGADEYEIAAETVEEIRTYKLDFIVSLIPQQPTGALLAAARRGVWYFQFGRSQCGQGAAGFWEIYRREPLSCARLECLSVSVNEGAAKGETVNEESANEETINREAVISEAVISEAIDREAIEREAIERETVARKTAAGKPAKEILRQVRLRTIDGSYAANLQQLLSESTRCLAQACRDIASASESAAAGIATAVETTGEVKGRSQAPNNSQYLFFSLRVRLNKLRNFLAHFLVHRHWGVALSFSPVHQLWQESDSVQAKLLPSPPRETFHADPFGMEYEGGLAILYEQWDKSMEVGKIAGSLLSSDDLQNLADQASRNVNETPVVPTSFETSFSFPHHCSYPYLFSHEGSTYCIPETGEGRTVALYRCAGHPGAWEHVTDIITDFAALDSSVIFYAGKWWLFCANLDDNPNSHLYLWYADELTGEWRAHGNNPVKLDICGGRPAGTPFEIEGELYRPSQDNSRNYGGGLTIQKISRLSPTSFKEERCGDLEQFSKRLGVGGMHTLSRVGDYTLLDYYRETFLPAIFVYRLKLYFQTKFRV